MERYFVVYLCANPQERQNFINHYIKLTPFGYISFVININIYIKHTYMSHIILTIFNDEIKNCLVYNWI